MARGSASGRSTLRDVFVFVHRVDETLGQGINRLTIFGSTFDDLVVNVGDIAHVFDGVTAGFEVTVHRIKHHHDPCMTQVTVVVHRHAAHVHAYLARFNGFKDFFVAGQAIVNVQHEGSSAG